ncbi:hypothetical protein SAMN02927921_02172 [Sinomicrobium oceani]|uniref:Uncharacterized protein n=1 Tax=Sinomicrobium oceani TaxID=1150368 RepID=A0A1K1Q183_9FLAO|nr:hypothetical protein [Sinomicrobium oceani]SFW53770.1 hypothetical protein SAMN02927921_02172 [Sinomicrobium oceani]
MRKPYISGLLYLFLLGNISCEQVKQSVRDTLREEPEVAETQSTVSDSTGGAPAVTEEEEDLPNREEVEPPRIPMTGNIEVLEKAEKALRNLPEFRDKPIYVYRSVYFYDDGRIHLQIQNAGQPLHVDTYRYNEGAWAEPEPVRLSVRDDIKRDLINLDEIPFANAFNVYQVLREKYTETGSSSEDYTFRLRIRNRTLRWYVPDIVTERESYALILKPDGTLKSMVKL